MGNGTTVVETIKTGLGATDTILHDDGTNLGNLNVDTQLSAMASSYFTGALCVAFLLFSIAYPQSVNAVVDNSLVQQPLTAAQTPANAPNNAKTDSWEHLDDGRVVVEIGSEKFAFDTASDNQLIVKFRMNREAYAIMAGKVVSDLPEHQFTEVSLKDVLEHPTQAHKAFTTSNFFAVVAPPLSTNKNSPLAQRKFDVSKLTNVQGVDGREFVFYSEPNLGAFEMADCAPSGASVISQKDSYGFSVASNGNASKSYYCLPAKQRHFKTPNDLKIECVHIIDDTCEAWFHGEKGNVTVGYAFLKSHFQESDWNALDGRMRNYFNNILLTQELQ